MSFLMSDILPTIRDLASNELADLGSTDTEQNAAIFRFTNIVLNKRARQAYIQEFSDVLNITSDGDQTFKKDTVDIEDLYEPLGVYVGTKYGRTITKRTSFEADNGWVREADNQKIDTRGVTGDHVLKYLRYPKAVTSADDPVEFPKASQTDLIMDVVSLIKLIKNYYQESEYIKAKATGTATVKASIAAKGTNSAPPSMTDREE